MFSFCVFILASFACMTSNCKFYVYHPIVLVVTKELNTGKHIWEPPLSLPVRTCASLVWQA